MLMSQKFEWFRYPFAINNFSGLTTCEQEQLRHILWRFRERRVRCR